MGRPKLPDGKRVSLSVKVSEAKAAAVDRRRGPRGRAAYLESLIDADLSLTGKPVPARNGKPENRPKARRAPAAAGPAPQPDMTFPVPFSAADIGNCPHPKSRRQKNGTYCGACGKQVA
jgi:hypothetical protein